MRVITLGTAGGRPTKHRNTSATAIVMDDGSWVLVDCGDGTLRSAMRMGLDTANLEGVLITHDHMDHMSGLTALLYDLKYTPNKELRLVAPMGVHSYVNTLLSFMPKGAKVVQKEASERNTFTIGGAFITCKEMVHTTTSFGYKLSADGKQVCVCGDNARPSALRHWVGNVDMVVHEATFIGSDDEGAAKWGHSTFESVMAAVEQWDVGNVIITHQGRWVTEEERDGLRAELVRGGYNHVHIANDFDNWGL